MGMRSISFRFDDEILNKLHYIADYEGRSANGQIQYMVRKLISDFEKEHGRIIFGSEAKETNHR